MWHPDSRHRRTFVGRGRGYILWLFGSTSPNHDGSAPPKAGLAGRPNGKGRPDLESAMTRVALIVCLLLSLSLTAGAQQEPSHPVRLKVTLPTGEPGEGTTTMRVTNPGSAEVNVVVQVEWFTDAQAPKAAARSSAKAPIPAGATVPIVVATAPGAYKQRVITTDVFGVPTVSDFVPSRPDPNGPAILVSSLENSPPRRKTVPVKYNSVIAQTLKDTGDVSVTLIVDMAGQVRDVVILTPGTYLRARVAEAVRQWEFETARVGGQVSLSVVPLVFSFSAPPSKPAPVPPER